MKPFQSLESEMDDRRNSQQHTADLIEQLKERVRQLVERYYHHTRKSSENSQHLLIDLLNEVQELAIEAVQAVAKDLEQSEGSLLPALRKDPAQLILSAIEELSTADLEDYVLENFSDEDFYRIRQVYKMIRNAVKNLKKQVKHSPEEMIDLFEQAKERFCRENEKLLSLYRSGCENCHDDRLMLDAKYSKCRAVQLWIENDMDICKTLKAMDDEGCVEKELIALYAYILRVEILHQIAVHAKAMTMLPVSAPTPAAPSDKQVKDALEDTLVDVKNSRLWYCIYKPLVQVGIIKKGDFYGFKKYITSLIGQTVPEINPKDLSSKIDNGSFRTKDIDQWDESDAPVDGKTFDYYKRLAEKFLGKLRP